MADRHCVIADRAFCAGSDELPACGLRKILSWIDPGGLDYFRRRVMQARRDSDEALAITLEYCNTPELQREAVRALEFKCDVLWSMLDAIHHGYFKEGRSPVRPSAGNFGGRETAAPC